MSMKNVHNNKRKCCNSGSNIQKRICHQPQLIYQVKAVEVSLGNYHYFGKTYNSSVEERLESGWMNKNHMGTHWRRNHLRGRKKQKLGKWLRLPIGRSVSGKL